MRAFDNDSACDWAYGLEEVDDLSLVEETIAAAEAAGADLDEDIAVEALAAIEVLARLSGRPDLKDTYAEAVDDWVKAHPVAVPAELRQRSLKVIALIEGPGSGLAALWAEADPADASAWRESLKDLAARVKG